MSHPTILDYTFYTFIILIALIVTVGNSLVVLSLIIDKSLRSPPHLYIGSLALVDLSVGIFIIPLRIVQVLQDNTWPFGPMLCGIYTTSDIGLCTLSIYHLIAIAADRYRAIAQGLRYVQRRSYFSVGLTIAFLWVVSLWISTPPALGWHNMDWGLKSLGNEANSTICILTRDQGYVFHSTLGSFILPMFLLTFLYHRIYVGIKERLRQKARPASMNFFGPDGTSESCSSEDILNDKVKSKAESGRGETFKKKIQFRLSKIRRNHSIPAENTNDATNEVVIEPTLTPSTSSSSQLQQFVQKKMKFSLTKEKRAARTLGIIIGAFTICWVPFSLLYVTDAFVTPINDTIYFEISAWLGYINSGMNPFIYCYFNKQFRHAFSKILCCNWIKIK